MWKGKENKHIHDIFFNERSLKGMLRESLVILVIMEGLFSLVWVYKDSNSDEAGTRTW